MRQSLIVFVCIVTAALGRSAAAFSEAKGINRMDEQQFWATIERTTEHQTDPDRQVAALEAELNRLSAEQIVAFEEQFQDKMARAYRWDLWGAAYVANGGASDDGFDNFRRWLISRGQETYETVLANPDDLADMLADPADGTLEFEKFGNVATWVWGDKTGKDPYDIPVNPGTGEEPAGEEFDEDPEWLKAHYPRLWQHSPMR